MVKALKSDRNVKLVLCLFRTKLKSKRDPGKLPRHQGLGTNLPEQALVLV